MVQKKLNFNQPILSVRRYSLKTDSQIADQRKESTDLPMLPSHRPESNSGPVSNPGSVPFLWEQIPGQPKEEILARSSSELPPNQTEAQETSRDLDESSTTLKAIESGNSSQELAVDGLDFIHGTHDFGVYVIKPKNQEHEQRRKVVNQDKAILLHCRPSFEKRNYFYCNEKERSDDGGGQHENVITVCCLLPRSCLKSSLCNLNLDHATRVMNRVMTFPLSSSSTGSENEYAVKPTDKIGTFLEETQDGKSFVTLQELLLADKEWPKEKAVYLDAVKKTEREDDGGDDVKTSDEMKMVEDSDSDQDWSSEEEDIRVAVNKAAENARKKQQLSRSDVPTPPLPRSPSDSWLFRTLSASTKKASLTPTIMSRFSNKY